MTTTESGAGEDKVPVHPGLILDQLLRDRNVQDATFADATGLSRPLVSQVTRGNRRVTQNTAQKIVEYFAEGNVMDWLRRQQEYDLWLQSNAMSEADGSSN